MASSTMCSNCGKEGHFRSTCPLPKHESLRHWHDAKAQFRRENPREAKKQEERKAENMRWKMEGLTVSFSVLNDGVCDMLQVLTDIHCELDVMGRPKDWEEANKKLNLLLPLIRELHQNGKGFVYYGRLKDVAVDGDIFVSRLDQLEELRDKIVKRVKSFVNGTLGKLAAVNSRHNPQELLRYVFATHPPKRAFSFDAKALNGSTLRNNLKKALLYYHPDKQVEYDADWKSLCEEISRCMTHALMNA